MHVIIIIIVLLHTGNGLVRSIISNKSSGVSITSGTKTMTIILTLRTNVSIPIIIILAQRILIFSIPFLDGVLIFPLQAVTE